MPVAPSLTVFAGIIRVNPGDVTRPRKPCKGGSGDAVMVAIPRPAGGEIALYGAVRRVARARHAAAEIFAIRAGTNGWRKQGAAVRNRRADTGVRPGGEMTPPTSGRRECADDRPCL